MRVVNIATCAENSFNSKFKTALIIYNASNDPQHFEQCVEEKLTSFVQKDFKLNCCDNNMIFLSKVDRLDCNEMKDAKILKKYDVIFTTLYATNFNKAICLKLKKYIESKRITLVFLRGMNNAILTEMELLKTSHINFGYGWNYCLDNTVLNEMKEKSNYLQQFCNKYNDTIDTAKGDVSKVGVSDTYIAQIASSDIINIDDWYALGLHSDAVTNDTNYSTLFHKKYKIFISQWYGFSHGNEFAHDLISYLLQYLLFEHLEFKNLKIFIQNLKEKYENCKLIDIQINFQ